MIQYTRMQVFCFLSNPQLVREQQILCWLRRKSSWETDSCDQQQPKSVLRSILRKNNL